MFIKFVVTVIAVVVGTIALELLVSMGNGAGHAQAPKVPEAVEVLPAFTVSPLDTINVAPQGPLVVQSRVFKAIPFTDFPSTCSLTLLDAAGNVHSLFVDGRGPHGSLCMFDIGDDVRTPSKAN